jgi:hypothetical protein
VLPRRIISMVEQVCNEFIWSLDSQKGYKPRIAWEHVCLPRSFRGLNICNLQVWNDVALLKSFWALLSKKIRHWIKWVHDYYIKGADIMHFSVPSTASWMLTRIIESRKQVADWNELRKWVVNGYFSVKEAYLYRISNRPKPPWRSLWCNNKTSPRSIICLWQILRNQLPTKHRLNK